MPAAPADGPEAAMTGRIEVRRTRLSRLTPRLLAGVAALLVGAQSLVFPARVGESTPIAAPLPQATPAAAAASTTQFSVITQLAPLDHEQVRLGVAVTSWTRVGAASQSLEALRLCIGSRQAAGACTNLAAPSSSVPSVWSLTPPEPGREAWLRLSLCTVEGCGAHGTLGVLVAREQFTLVAAPYASSTVVSFVNRLDAPLHAQVRFEDGATAEFTCELAGPCGMAASIPSTAAGLALRVTTAAGIQAESLLVR